MKLCRWLGSLVVLAGLTAVVPNLPVFAGDKEAKLEWKAFDKGSKYFQTMTVKTEQKMTVMGMTVNQTQDQTFYAAWTAGEKDKDNWTVGMKIIGAKMDINIGGNKISYDSTDDKVQQNPLTDFFNALLKLDLKFTISPKMTVEKIEGNEELIKNLGKTNPQMEPLLKSILDSTALKRMAEPPLFAFPTTAVKKGTTWKKESELNLGPIGKYTNEYTFEYAGKYSGKDDKKKGLDEITVKATMKYSPPTDKGGKLPFVILPESKLSGDDGKGTVLYNPTKGRFDDYSLTMSLKGDLDIDIGGMKTKVSLQQDQSSRVITSDTDPIAELKSKKKS